MITLSLELMFYGLAGVFISLVILYFTIKIMAKVFPADKE